MVKEEYPYSVSMALEDCWYGYYDTPTTPARIDFKSRTVAFSKILVSYTRKLKRLLSGS